VNEPEFDVRFLGDLGKEGEADLSKRKGSKGAGELERLVEAWLATTGWRSHRAAAVLVRLPGGRTFSKMHDIMGVFDFIAVKPNAQQRGGDPLETWALQTTAPDNRGVRRKKVEAAGPWPHSWRVSILHHLSARVGRESLHWFMIEDYRDGEWSEPVKVQVDVNVLKEFRSEKHAERKVARVVAAAEREAREAGRAERRATRERKAAEKRAQVAKKAAERAAKKAAKTTPTETLDPCPGCARTAVVPTPGGYCTPLCEAEHKASDPARPF
jgi:hypothetical protein